MMEKHSGRDIKKKIRLLHNGEDRVETHGPFILQKIEEGIPMAGRSRKQVSEPGSTDRQGNSADNT